MLVPMGDPWRVFSEGLKEIGNDLPRVIPKLKNSTRIGFK
jgi:hypothetical protein